MIREKYCVDSETKQQQKENNWDLDASENGTDRTLFCWRQRPFERTCLSLYGRDSCCGARYAPAFLAHVHTRARRPLWLMGDRCRCQKSQIWLAHIDYAVKTGSFKYLNLPSLTSCVHRVPVSPTLLESITVGFSKIYSISAAQFQQPSPADLRHFSFLQQISAGHTLLKTSRPLIYNLITVIPEPGFKFDCKALEPGSECMNTAFSHEGY